MIQKKTQMNDSIEISLPRKAWNEYKEKLKKLKFKDWVMVIVILIGRPAIPFTIGFYFATLEVFSLNQIFCGFVLGIGFFWIIQLWVLSD